MLHCVCVVPTTANRFTFKYKVNQIDIVNGDIDVDNFGDEIAGPIGFDEGNPVHLTLSKNIEWKLDYDR